MGLLKTLSTIALLLASANGASALYLNGPQRVNTIQDGEFVLAPLAFVKFCNTYKRDCSDAPGRAVVRLDERAWQMMRSVNLKVNRSIRPRSDVGADVWSLGRRSGDCDDYAVEKRHRLMAAGLPQGALSLTEVVARGEGHLVLTVRTDQGDFILDNLNNVVRPWNATGYRFVKMQSASNANYWVAVDGTGSGAMVADAE